MRYWSPVDLDERIEFFIFPTEILRDLHNDFSELIGEKLTRIILFQAGYRSGYGIARRMNLEYTEPKEMEDLLIGLTIQFGLGIYEVKESSEKKVVLTCKDSREAMAMGNTGEPSCYLTGGYLTGIVSWVTERRFRCIEKTCISAGDRECRFVIHR